MDPDYLRHCVYYDGALDGRFTPLPGLGLCVALEYSQLEPADFVRTGRKIEQSIRKLLMMWTAGDSALEAEREFYATTIQDAPALIGSHAVEVQYHCEALIFFARSALDIASYAFGNLLPSPIAAKRTDSFNDLLKAIIRRGQDDALTALVEGWRVAEPKWLPLVAEFEKGRSLRDKLAHQTGFPLDYDELSLTSEKRSAVVVLDDSETIPLKVLVETLRTSVIAAFLSLEALCESYQVNEWNGDGSIEETPSSEGIAE